MIKELNDLKPIQVYLKFFLYEKIGNSRFEAGTGKSLSEALILGSTNPEYDKRLFST